MGPLDWDSSRRSVANARRSTGLHALCTTGHFLGSPAGESLRQIVRRLCISEVRNGWPCIARLNRSRCSVGATKRSITGRSRATIDPFVGHNRKCRFKNRIVFHFQKYFSKSIFIQIHMYDRKRGRNTVDPDCCPTIRIVWPVWHECERLRRSRHSQVVDRTIRIWCDCEVRGPVVNGVAFGVVPGRSKVGNGMRWANETESCWRRDRSMKVNFGKSDKPDNNISFKRLGRKPQGRGRALRLFFIKIFKF